jgi:hypothetical protein
MGAQLPVEPQPAATPKSRVVWGLGCGFCALILLAIVIQLYADVWGDVTLAKAQADVRTLASAVEQYKAHMGVPPATLTDLTSRATNARGQTAGPYMGSIPAPSSRFSNYRYERHADGRWSITTSGKDSCGRAQKVEATAGSPSFQNRFVSCPWRRLFFSDGN